MGKFKLKNTPEAKLIIMLHHAEHNIFKSKIPRVLKSIVLLFFSVLNHLIIQILFNCIIPKGVKMGKNITLPHPFGIVMTPHLKIGDNVKIMHQVTIGRNELSDKPVEGIEICDNVFIGAGAKIIGNSLRIGSGSIIGANAVVVKDVPDGATVVGVPARKIR